MYKCVPVLTALITSLCVLPVASAQTTVPAGPSPSPLAPEKAGPEAATPPSTTSTPAVEPSVRPAQDARPAYRAGEASVEMPLFGKPNAAPTPLRLRDGFYLRVSGGPAGLLLTGDGPGRSASIGGGGWAQGFSIGGSVARGLVLAGTVQSATVEASFKGGPFRNATLNTDGGQISASHLALASFTELGLLVDWYPDPRAGFHGGVSAGLGLISITNRADDGKLYGLSPAGTLFAGYDWAIGRDWSIGMSLVGSGASAASIKHTSGGSSTGYQLTPLSLSFQASILYF
jgi:hypothetical protein